MYFLLAVFLFLLALVRTDDIDDTSLQPLPPKHPSLDVLPPTFESPRVITLFSNPQQIHPKPIIGDKCRPVAPDRPSPFVVVQVPSAAQEQPKPQKVTATVTSAFQMEAFLQSLGSILGSNRNFTLPPAPTSTLSSYVPPIAPTNGSRCSSPSLGTSTTHVTSTIFLTTHRCVSEPTSTQNLFPMLPTVMPSLPISTPSSPLPISATTPLSTPVKMCPPSSCCSLTVPWSPTASHSTTPSPVFAPTLRPAKNMTTVTVSACPSILTTSQDNCLMINIPDSAGHNMVIQIPRPWICGK